MVAYQGEASGGKLHPDLMTSSGVQPDTHQAFFSSGEPNKFQPGFLHATAFLLYYEDLVLAAVLEEEVLQYPALGGNAVHQASVFLHKLTLLNEF